MPTPVQYFAHNTCPFLQEVAAAIEPINAQVCGSKPHPLSSTFPLEYNSSCLNSPVSHDLPGAPDSDQAIHDSH